MANTDDIYLPVNTVMNILNCTEQHIRDLIEKKELEGIRIGIGKNGSYGRAIRISKKSLDEFIERRKIKPEDIFEPVSEEEKEQSLPTPQPLVARSRWINK